MNTDGHSQKSAKIASRRTQRFLGPMQERWRRKKAGGGGSVADLTSKFETNSIKTTPVNPVAPPRRTSLARGEKPLLSTHQEPTPTDPGTPRYGTAGREAPPPSSTGAAADELGDAAVAELAELAAEAARLAAEATLSLEASLAVETAKWRLRAAVGGEGGESTCRSDEVLKEQTSSSLIVLCHLQVIEPLLEPIRQQGRAVHHAGAIGREGHAHGGVGHRRGAGRLPGCPRHDQAEREAASARTIGDGTGPAGAWQHRSLRSD